MSTANMQAILRDVGHVPSSVVEVLNNLSGFQVRIFAPNGDDSSGEGISLPQYLDTLIQALVTIVSKSATSAEGVQRVDVLVKGLRLGLTILRRHCNEFRSRMRVASVHTLMANIGDQDLDRRVGELFDAATIPRKLYVSPPDAADCPAVVTQAWTGLTSYLIAGGLRNSLHQSQHQSSASGPGKPRYLRGRAGLSIVLP